MIAGRSAGTINDISDAGVSNQQVAGLPISLAYGIGSSDLSFGRTRWSAAFNRIVVAA